MPCTRPSGMRIGTLTCLPIGIAWVIGNAIATGSVAVSAISCGSRPARM